MLPSPTQYKIPISQSSSLYREHLETAQRARERERERFLFSMDDFRSKSYADGRMQTDGYNYDGGNRLGPPPAGLQDLRSYSASYVSSSSYPNPPPPPTTQMDFPRDVKFKKGKSTNGSESKNWSLADPELQRKKRVASYKAYTVEGKVKGSFRKSFRWIKDRYNLVVHGWR